ncbi:MAG: hypothetical protein WCK17_10130 [Verrucomicrobiota bacterium]
MNEKIGKFRPKSYWPNDPLSEILFCISEPKLRKSVIQIWNAGNVKELDEVIRNEEVPQEAKTSWNVCLAALASDAPLPARQLSTKVIAEINLAAVNLDKIELRATQEAAGTIKLKWVDEYQTEFSPSTKRISQPFSFAELIDFITKTSAGDYSLPLGYNQYNFEAIGDPEEDSEELIDFTVMHSAFYPKLGDWMRTQAAEWVSQKRLEAETAEDE